MRRYNAKSNTLKVHGIEIPSEFPTSITDTDAFVHYDTSVFEAKRIVELSQGRTFYIRVRGFAKAMKQGDAPEGSTRGREVIGSVPVSKKQALKFIDEAYGTIRDTHWIRLSICSTCFFIG